MWKGRERKEEHAAPRKSMTQMIRDGWREKDNKGDKGVIWQREKTVQDKGKGHRKMSTKQITGRSDCQIAEDLAVFGQKDWMMHSHWQNQFAQGTAVEACR